MAMWPVVFVFMEFEASFQFYFGVHLIQKGPTFKISAPISSHKQVQLQGQHMLALRVINKLLRMR